MYDSTWNRMRVQLSLREDGHTSPAPQACSIPHNVEDVIPIIT